MNEQICIFGAGGFGRETLCCLIDSLKQSGHSIEGSVCFMVDDQYLQVKEIMGVPVLPKSQLDLARHRVVVAVGEPADRRRIVSTLPAETRFATIIHPTAVISDWVTLGEGSVVTAGAILTCNIRIGKHAHIDRQATIGHDCVIGDYFTAAPGSVVSGNCTIGDGVYLGTHSCIKQRLQIADGTTVGMGAVVTKNLSQSGIYIGNPARPMPPKTGA